VKRRYENENREEKHKPICPGCMMLFRKRLSEEVAVTILQKSRKEQVLRLSQRLETMGLQLKAEVLEGFGG
jgi:hypothetical protein